MISVFFYSLFSTFPKLAVTICSLIFLLLTGFETRISGLGTDSSANWATTTPKQQVAYLTKLINRLLSHTYLNSLHQLSVQLCSNIFLFKIGIRDLTKILLSILNVCREQISKLIFCPIDGSMVVNSTRWWSSRYQAK